VDERNSEHFSPKTAACALPGSIHAEYVRCGKATCRCAQGELHGPYWRRFWRADGRTRSVYIRLAELPLAVSACAGYAALHPSGRTQRRRLRAFAAMHDEMMGMLDRHGATGGD
jgi:hypothetical protein